MKLNFKYVEWDSLKLTHPAEDTEQEQVIVRAELNL
jgi:hypothetical protein